ncbi:hypothetical protein GQ43DRAFT_381678, partial [Delitschia confertaspora ATCC 74209]
LHCRAPTDTLPTHLDKPGTVMLVDSVINDAKTMEQFVRRIRAHKRQPFWKICIMIVAGVVQNGFIAGGRKVGQMFRDDEKLSLGDLRTSENKYAGRGVTGPGDRLFNI